MSRFSLQPTFDTLQCGKPRVASPLLSGVVCHSGERGEGSQMFVRRGPPRSPSPYPFIYYLACEQARCKPARIGKGEGDPFLVILFTLSAYREPVHRLQTIFYEKGTYPFRIPSVDEWCLFHIPSVSPLGPFTDPHDRSSYPFVYFNE